MGKVDNYDAPIPTTVAEPSKIVELCKQIVVQLMDRDFATLTDEELKALGELQPSIYKAINTSFFQHKR